MGMGSFGRRDYLGRALDAFNPLLETAERRKYTRNVPVVIRYQGATKVVEINDRQERWRNLTQLDGTIHVFTSGDATPSVLGGGMFQTAGTTAITDFDDGVIGDILYIEANSTITITHGTPIQLNGDANYAMVAGDTLVLGMFTDQVWHEISRGGQSASSGGGAKTATLVVGPSANSDSASYDYVTDGTADNTEIQSALSALPAGGGKVILREGTYNFAGDITLATSNVTLEGQGGGVLLNCSSETVDNSISLNGSNCLVENISFNGVLLFLSTNSVARSLRFTDIYEFSMSGEFWDNCYFSAWGQKASDTSAVVATNNAVFVNCFFDGSSTGATAAYITGTNTRIYNCTFVVPNSVAQDLIQYSQIVANCKFTIGTSFTGTVILPNTGGHVIGNYISISGSSTNAIAIDASADKVMIADNFIDMSTGVVTTIAIQGAGTGIKIIGNSIVDSGIAISIGSKGCHAIGNTAIGCTGHNYKISGEYIIFNGNAVADSSPGTDDTYSGIQLGTSADHCVLDGNIIIGDDAANTLKYCIEETTLCDYNIITSNIARGATTGQINVVGANTVSANNITT